jgi:hypothetical protein
MEISGIFEDLVQDISSIKDETQVITTILMGAVQGSKKFFSPAQRDAVFSDGRCQVLECISTMHLL